MYQLSDSFQISLSQPITWAAFENKLKSLPSSLFTVANYQCKSFIILSHPIITLCISSKKGAVPLFRCSAARSASSQLGWAVDC
jgi:hypothetical protein